MPTPSVPALRLTGLPEESHTTDGSTGAMLIFEEMLER
jgi:hypothetical protein